MVNVGGSPCEIFRKGSRPEDFLYLYPSSYVCAGFVLFNFVLTYLLLIVVGNSYRTSKTIPSSSHSDSPSNIACAQPALPKLSLHSLCFRPEAYRDYCQEF